MEADGTGFLFTQYLFSSDLLQFSVFRRVIGPVFRSFFNREHNDVVARFGGRCFNPPLIPPPYSFLSPTFPCHHSERKGLKRRPTRPS